MLLLIPLISAALIVIRAVKEVDLAARRSTPYTSLVEQQRGGITQEERGFKGPRVSIRLGRASGRVRWSTGCMVTRTFSPS